MTLTDIIKKVHASSQKNNNNEKRSHPDSSQVAACCPGAIPTLGLYGDHWLLSVNEEWQC